MTETRIIKDLLRKAAAEGWHNGGAKHTFSSYLGGIGVAFFMTYSGLLSLGVPLPKPAWASDVDRVEQSVTRKLDTIHRTVLMSEISRKEAELRAINYAIQELRDKDEPVPAYLLTSQAQLVTQIAAQTNTLNRLPND